MARLVLVNNIIGRPPGDEIFRAVLGFEDPAGDVVILERAWSIGIVAVLPVERGEILDGFRAGGPSSERGVDTGRRGPLGFGMEAADERGEGECRSPAIGQGEGGIPAAAGSDADYLW